MLSRSYRWRDGGEPQNLGFSPGLLDLQQSPPKAPTPILGSTQGPFLPLPHQHQRRQDRSSHRVLDTVPYTVFSRVLAGMCGSQTMNSNVLIFPFSPQETRPSSWLATRRGGSSAGQLMGRSTLMRKALALKLGVSGPAATGCRHPGDVSPGPYTQSKLFWGDSPPTVLKDT